MAEHEELGLLERHDKSQADMMTEKCILVDSDDRAIGSATKIECHHGLGKLSLIHI